LNVSSVLVRYVLSGLLFLGAGTVRAGEIIRDQPGVERYGLSSGLEVVRVDTGEYAPPGAAADGLQMWLIVCAGTVHEGEAERGASTLAERVIRNGFGGRSSEQIDAMLISANTDDGSPPRSPGSLVTLDQTIFTGQTRTQELGEVEALLGFYAELLGDSAWRIDAAHLEAAKGSMRDKLDEYMSPELRARQRWLPRLLGPGPLGTRVGLPETEHIDRLDVRGLKSFVDRVYRPSRSTLLIVGDLSSLDLDATIVRTLGGLTPGPRGQRNDLREGVISGARVMGLDPDLEKHQAALVWMNTRGDACLEPWSVCAGRYSESMMRDLVIDRVAAELLRHRIDRLGVAALGTGAVISVDQISIAGQIDLLQCVVEHTGLDDEDWQRTLRMLVSETDRIARDGADRSEISRARGSLLARWHREAKSWRDQPDTQRAWLVHWFVTSGRPVVDMVRWDTRATELMATISDREINDALARLIDPRMTSVLAVTRGDPEQEQAMGARVTSFVDDVRTKPLAKIDPDWMMTLGGELFDETNFSGQIQEVTQHAPSDTWGATLASGVRVWTRPVGGDGDRVELCAMLWGDMFRDGSMPESQISAAMLAWRTPSSESRSARWLAVFCENHGIDVRARRVVGGVQLQVSAPAREIESAVGLLYLLLDRPMIDADTFADWKTRQQREPDSGDPLDRALAMLYQPELTRENEHDEVALDRAQRTLTRMVRNARIDIGIAGTVDPVAEIERAGSMLGQLVKREPPKDSAVEDAENEHAMSLRERSVEIQIDGDSPQMVLGVRGSRLNDLERLRATILATMVLSDRARALGIERGISGTQLDAQVVLSEALGNRWALILRVRGDDLTGGETVLSEAAVSLVAEGIGVKELEAVKAELDASIARYFDRASYWSTRLSTLGQQGRSVDDLWTIRAGYADVSASDASTALREAIGTNDRFRIILSPSGQR
jgi:predicted Zn-dependent peptidase